MIEASENLSRLSPMARPLVQRIAEMIEMGQLRAGDRLPTVRQLASEQRVSYAIAIQAISHLEAVGIVETLQGSGTYVAERRPSRSNKGSLSNQVFFVSTEIPQTYATYVHPIIL